MAFSSILISRENYRPFWNHQNLTFQKYTSLEGFISNREMYRAANERKVNKTGIFDAFSYFLIQPSQCPASSLEKGKAGTPNSNLVEGVLPPDFPIIGGGVDFLGKFS